MRYLLLLSMTLLVLWGYGQSDEQRVVLVIHGGAGTILRSQMTPQKEKEYKDALSAALHKGYSILKNGEVRSMRWKQL